MCLYALRVRRAIKPPPYQRARPDDDRPNRSRVCEVGRHGHTGHGITDGLLLEPVDCTGRGVIIKG